MKTDRSASLILGSNLVSFLPGISAEERSRTLDCLMFCELRANQAADRVKQWDRWIDTFQRMLPVTGFIQTAVLGGAPVKVSNKKRFQRESKKIVGRINSPSLGKAAEDALNTMFESPQAQSFFSSWLNFSSGRSDSFQIIPCMKSHTGHIEIAICGLQMITRTKLKPIPVGPWPFTYEMTLTLRGGCYAFESTNYNANRERIEQDLREGGAEFIERISL
ncbi:hypothetical protein [Pseudomonas folii]|jgi:hypothetical protein|uniref:Uncharacterized protein n=1 Tax=Pseudomonas folii TaxID=2762593 RepID=A0ABR7B2E4_9PSED|nr:hypothetical protein [Pseudomonas folii]MBC3951360.1 hypothetical protein [Pseudomonas folii]